MPGSRWLVVLVAVVCALMLPISASAAPSTPRAPAPDGTGPPLHVPDQVLDRSLSCSQDLARSDREPVLLVPGTALPPREFSWNYVPALHRAGYPVCTVTLPQHGMEDIQTAGEYVVHALRTMHQVSGRKTEIIGHSQGGMVPRWAMRFWPDTRGMIDDLVGLAPSNHGTLDANAVCAATCAPAFWQQRTTSRFTRALNTPVETWPGVSYTNTYSALDEVLIPNLGPRPTPGLYTGDGAISNISLQSMCPGHPAEHLSTGTTDTAAYALAMDALTHPGPADPARVARSVCLQPALPGVDPVTLPANEAQLASTVAEEVALHPHTTAEPPLRPYARPETGRSAPQSPS